MNGPFIARACQECGEQAASLRWLSSVEARVASQRREELLAALRDRVQLGCKETKLDCRRLSPGCALCGRGTWSCLFINGRCNCQCFYCPTAQDDLGVPMTNGLPFPQAEDYAEYLERFGFEGASLSGGEPFLTLDRTLTFIAAVKRRLADAVHLWLYTNGTLVDEELLDRLVDAGLDEIRFNISAAGYDLKKAKLAVGRIRTVAVEIPAVPEEEERLKAKIVEMAESGIDYLNLHQLRLTPHNLPQLAARNYTFLPGEKVAVLESELMALRLIRHALDRAIDLPINYCSSAYKDRYQHAAARRRGAQIAKKPFEEITENGYLRSLSVSGNSERLRVQAEILAGSTSGQELWRLSQDRLYFSSRLWPAIDLQDLRLRVEYSEAKIRPVLSYCHPFVEVELASGRSLFVERMAAEAIEFEAGEAAHFAASILAGKEDLPADQKDEKWKKIRAFEFIPAGLQEYC